MSCYRQIKSSELEHKDEKVSRSYVQKSVVLLTRIPLFGMLLAKLQPSTHAYFNQLNFSDTEILQQFYNNVNEFGSNKIEYSDFFSGLDIKRLFLFLKHQTLTLLKLLMCEGRVVVYSLQASKVTSFLLSLVPMFPGILCFTHKGMGQVEAAQKSWQQHGLPLKIFH